MNKRLQIILIIADLAVASILIYLAIFYPPKITINYDTSQLIAISGASGVGIFLLYFKRLREYNPKTVKLLELLLYLVPPTMASFPFLAKVNYFLIIIVPLLVMLGWFIFGLVKVGTSENKEEKKRIRETIVTTGIITGGIVFLLLVLLWWITLLCTQQCKNPLQ